MEVFLCNKRKIAVKPTITQNVAVLKAFLRKFYKHCSLTAILNPENYSILREPTVKLATNH